MFAINRQPDMLTYCLALAMSPGFTPQHGQRMRDAGIMPDEIYTSGSSIDSLNARLDATGRGRLMLEPLLQGLEAAKEQRRYAESHGIQILTPWQEGYPIALLEIPAHPLALFKLGCCDLNCRHSLGVVGTRRCTAYGQGFVKSMVAELGALIPDLCVVSGLAFGIDAAAHKAALDASLPTVGVLAHGLDMVYPAEHRDLARRIVGEGGALVTEYPPATRPFPNRFLARNRIVAGMTPATIVAESPIKGGAMSTAQWAFDHNRDVLALPGRVTDEASAGCNHLIRSGKASLVTGASDIMQALGWETTVKGIRIRQANLFPELTPDQQKVYDLMRYHSDPMPIDILHQKSGIPISTLHSILGDMEFDGVLNRLPGNRYMLCM